MKNRTLMPLFWLMLFDTASYTIRFPVLTLVFYDAATRLFAPTTSMSVRSWWYGVCMALYWIGSIIAAPILATWSDYAGRKKILIFGAFGTFIFALSTALGVFWGAIGWILLGALIGGLCARMDPIAQAAVGDACVAENKMLYMSYLQLFISIGAFFGPIIGGYFAQHVGFAQLNFSLPFMIAAVFAVIGIIILLAFFRETAPLRVTVQTAKFASFKAVIFNKKVIQISLLLILIQISWSTYYQFIAPILKKDFQFSGTEIGFFMGMIAFWLALASAFGIPILQRYFSMQKIILYAVLGILAGLVCTLVAISLPMISWMQYLTWIFTIPIAAGDVITYCVITALYSSVVEVTAQGQVMGVNFIIVSGVWAVTALLGGLLIGISTALPLLFAAVSLIVLIFILGFMKNLNYFSGFQGQSRM